MYFFVLFQDIFRASVSSVVDAVTLECNVHSCTHMQNNDGTAIGFHCAIIMAMFNSLMFQDMPSGAHMLTFIVLQLC
jgi:hypothetical protein